MSIRRFLVAAALCICTGLAFAGVEANTADQAALDGIKGLGPTSSKAILAERQQRGAFRNWADFSDRVKGMGEKRSKRLSQAGLTINGKPMPGVPAPTNTLPASRRATMRF